MNNEELAKELTDKVMEVFEKTMNPVAWRVRYPTLQGNLSNWCYFDNQEDATAVADGDGQIEDLYLSPSQPQKGKSE